MNWKEFLKPNWIKIVIFLIIFIAFSLMPIWTTIRCSAWECMPGPTTSSFFDSVESMKNKEFYDFGYFTSWISIFFGFLIISYLLSCIIILIYDKVKKK
jgi:hypothetical protein